MLRGADLAATASLPRLRVGRLSCSYYLTVPVPDASGTGIALLRHQPQHGMSVRQAQQLLSARYRPAQLVSQLRRDHHIGHVTPTRPDRLPAREAYQDRYRHQPFRCSSRTITQTERAAASVLGVLHPKATSLALRGPDAADRGIYLELDRQIPLSVVPSRHRLAPHHLVVALLHRRADHPARPERDECRSRGRVAARSWLARWAARR